MSNIACNIRMIFIRPNFSLHPDELLDAMYDSDPDVVRVRQEYFAMPLHEPDDPMPGANPDAAAFVLEVYIEDDKT